MDFKTIKNPVVRTALDEQQQLPAPDGENERVHRAPAMSDWRGRHALQQLVPAPEGVPAARPAAE
ncbi:hypothetical protein [Rhizobium tropici]|uniref:hypothetical protein n=1 Tax=Rhizobium tropici TaxID=398 RepID=UPI001FDEED04|nr:hypothetical protein [Rhizobium tropici]